MYDKQFSGRTFEERNVIYQSVVARLAFPLRHDDTVLGLQRRVLRVRIEENDLAEVTVQVRKILQNQRLAMRPAEAVSAQTHLDDLALDVSRGFTVELVRQIRLERIELFRNGHGGLMSCGSAWRQALRGKEETYIERLRREEDDLVELRKVGEEVVYAWTLGCPPSVGSLEIGSQLQNAMTMMRAYIP